MAKPVSAFEGEIFIGLGSNLGDREEWLSRARELLQEDEEIQLRAQSSLYETEPVGLSDQPVFLNQVVEIGASHSAQELLAFLLNIERQLGRVRRQRWGPRNLDLDLLAFQNLELETENLTVPHPELARRRFVLAPWCEIAPAFVVPRWNLTVRQLLACCADSSLVAKLNKVRG